MAAAVLYNEINWDEAFNLFDKGEGVFSRETFTDLMNHWNFKLSSFDIESMLQLLGEQRQGKLVITREIFKEKIIKNLERLKDVARKITKQAIILEIHEKLKAKVDSLQDIFTSLDSSRRGIGDIAMFLRAFEELDYPLHLKAEKSIVLEAGDIFDEPDENLKFNYKDFCIALESAIDKEIQRRGDSTARIIEKLVIIMKAKKMTIFDAYCHFDVLQRNEISQLELITGLRSFGIDSPEDEIMILWQTIKEELKNMDYQTEDFKKIDYHTFLYMFTSRGWVKVEVKESDSSKSINQFMKRLKELELKIENFYSIMDPKGRGVVSKKTFLSVCQKKVKMNMMKEELEIVYSKLEDKREGGITFIKLDNLQQESSTEEEDLVRVYTKIHKISERRKIDWETVFKREKSGNKKKNQKKDGKYALNELDMISCLKKLRLGIKQADIEFAANNLVYNANDVISSEEFETQMEMWMKKYEKKREEKISILKIFVAKLNAELKKMNTTLDKIFGELDKDKDEALSLSEYNELIKRFNIDISLKDSATVFAMLAKSFDGKLRSSTLKKYMSSMDIITQIGNVEENTEEDPKKIEEEDAKEMLFQKIRSKLEEKKTNIKNILAKRKKDLSNCINLEGIKEIFKDGGLGELTNKELGILDREVKQTLETDKYSYKSFVDVMIHKRIDNCEAYGGNSLNK